MTTIMPQSELTRKAVAWICEARAEKAATSLTDLIDEAAMRFNLSPKDVDLVTRFFKDNKEQNAQ